MLLCIQFPIADSRMFLTFDSGKLNLPTWPSPVPNQEFVRFFGGVKTRRRGGVIGWLGENEICEAQHAFRFIPSEEAQRFGRSIPLHCAFKRLYFDGLATGKFEVGVSPKYIRRHRLRRLGFKTSTKETPKLDQDLIESFLHLPIEIKDPSGGKNRCELHQAGKHLAPLYASASTTTVNDASAIPEDWWVKDGPPLLFLENNSREHLSLPYKTKVVRVPKRYGFTLSYWVIPFKGKSIRTWALGIGDNCNLKAARLLRLYLLRLNAEHACLRSVLRNIEANHIKIARGTEASNTLQFYLHCATNRIKRWESNSQELIESDIAVIARASEDFISPGQLDALIERLRILNIRKNIFDKVEKYATEWEGSRDTSITLIGGTVVMGDEYKVSGQVGAVGRGAHAHDMNFNQIWNQVKEEMDLPSLAQELSRLRVELKKEAKDPEHDIAVGAVALAESAAQKGEGSKALEYLSSAGKWALDVATKIGVSIASEAIKKALGM